MVNLWRWYMEEFTLLLIQLKRNHSFIAFPYVFHSCLFYSSPSAVSLFVVPLFAGHCDLHHWMFRLQLPLQILSKFPDFSSSRLCRTITTVERWGSCDPFCSSSCLVSRCTSWWNGGRRERGSQALGTSFTTKWMRGKCARSFPTRNWGIGLCFLCSIAFSCLSHFFVFVDLALFSSFPFLHCLVLSALSLSRFLSLLLAVWFVLFLLLFFRLCFQCHGRSYSPVEIVDEAEKLHAPTITFSYNEPTTFLEFGFDVMK